MSHVVCRMGNTRTGMFVPSAGDTTIPPSLYMCRYAGDIVARRTRWEPPAIVQGVLKGSSASFFFLQKITSVYGHINGLGKRARYLCSPARSDISRMYSGAETWLLLQKHKHKISGWQETSENVPRRTIIVYSEKNQLSLKALFRCFN